MSKKTKNKLLIIILYIISLFLFEFFIGQCNFKKAEQECFENGYFFTYIFGPYIGAGVYHFIFISFIAICVALNKKIDTQYKHIVYWLPIATYTFSFPMGMVCMIIYNFFNTYIIG